LGIGYQVGTLSNSDPLAAVTRSDDTKPEPKERAEDENVDGNEDGDEVEDISDGDLGSISAGFLEPCKLVRLVIRGFTLSLFISTGIGSGCSYGP
jgi:PTH2 family peptidyl-tRNA hydrolase